MKIIVILLFCFFASTAFAARVECLGAGRVIVVQNSGGNVLVTFQGETVVGDGLLSTEEVDVIAKFKSAGEMTLFAKVGEMSPENYAFVQGKRFSVNCR